MDTIDTQTGAVTASADMPDQVGLAIDSSTGTLYGLTSCCPSNVVSIDPSTGAETTIASLAGTAFSSMTVVGHSLYVASTSFDTFPATETMISVDASTGAVTAGPSLPSGVIVLGGDSSSVALYGKTFRCPTHIVRIDPSTGAETTIGSFDLGYGNSLAIDPSTHSIYAMEDVLGGDRVRPVRGHRQRPGWFPLAELGDSAQRLHPRPRV